MQDIRVVAQRNARVGRQLQQRVIGVVNLCKMRLGVENRVGLKSIFFENCLKAIGCSTHLGDVDVFVNVHDVLALRVDLVEGKKS